MDNAKFIVDGASGDVDYPFGKIKPIATVGEYDSDAELVVGVPDGMGAILLDDETVRVIVQSESYGPVVRYESYPWFVHDKKGCFTGSHVQYVDYDREMLAAFHDADAPETAESMVKGCGELVKRAYNLKGEVSERSERANEDAQARLRHKNNATGCIRSITNSFAPFHSLRSR